MWAVHAVLPCVVLATQALPARAQDTATSAPDAAASEPAADPAPPAAAWQLRIEAPTELRELLAKYLDLARFQKAVDTDRITRAELGRLVAAAPAQARALAETLGYFSAQVQARITGEERAGQVAQVQVQVAPGPRTQVRAVRIEFEGPLSLALDGGEGDAIELARRIRQDWSLQPGAPFAQPTWSSAKNAALTRLRAEGYLAATLSGSTAQVDAPTAAAELYVVIDSGPLFHFGKLAIEGLSLVKQDVIDYLAPFSPGARYREQVLLDFQDRLVKTNLFDSAAVVVEPDTSLAQALPVHVRLRERPRHQLTLGAGASDLTGPRVTLEHSQQSFFGLAWQSKSKIELGRTQSTVQLDLISHPNPDLWRDLWSGAASRSENATLIVNSQRARVGRSQDSENIDRLYYLEWQHATSMPIPGTTGTLDEASSVTANYQWIWRDLDSPVLPTRGLSATVEAGPGYAFSATEDSGGFGRVRARITGYWPFGDTWYAQVRGEAGQVFARDTVTVPITLLFRAGGDESVRGYSYQSLGPTKNGQAVGGRVLAAGSIEVARPFSSKTPAWLGAVFLDAGDAAMRWEDFSGALGYGVGVRWRSPVGPLRVDLAYGEETRKTRLHFSVGVVF
jgi:translocation and assembly module TamA